MYRSPIDIDAAHDDADCIARSLLEPDQFGLLYERHASTVFRYVRARLGAGADDAVGETFALAFQRRASFDADRGRTALPWLLGIATNVISQRRADERRWLRPHPDPGVAVGDRSDDTTERLDAERLTPWLRDSLRALRRRDRDALFLHVVGDLSIEQVAAALDVAPGTVKSRLHRARRILAAQLEVHR